MHPPVPELTAADVAFGNIKHMPKYETLPEDFRRHRGTIFNEAISAWFFRGMKRIKNGFEVEIFNLGQERIARFTAKPGVDGDKALAAIRAILGSFEPKHEHKEAGTAYLLSEWFDVKMEENGHE